MAPEQRERVVRTALALLQDQEKYHVLFHNCEHAVKKIYGAPVLSFCVRHLAWISVRMGLCCLGLVLLAWGSWWALLAYHVCISLPVGLQCVIQFVRSHRSIRRQRQD